MLDKGAACLDLYFGRITWQQYNRQIEAGLAWSQREQLVEDSG